MAKQTIVKGQRRVRLSVTVSGEAKRLLAQFAKRERRTASSALDVLLLKTLKEG